MIIAGDEIVKSDALRGRRRLRRDAGRPRLPAERRPTARTSSPSTPASWAALSRDQKQVRDAALQVRPADRAGRRSGAHVGVERGRAAARRHARRAHRPRRLGHGQELSPPRWRCAPMCARLCSRSRRSWRSRAASGSPRGPRRRWRSCRAATGRPNAPSLPPRIEDARQDASRSIGDWLSLQIAKALPTDAVVVNEGLTSARHLTDLVPYRDRYGFHALASGGIGWGLPAAVGVALAQAPRPVCCFSGDGSAMYSIQALWTAAHHKLPITYVIANNGGYRIIKQRLKSFHGNDHYIGMDFVDPRSTSRRSPSRWACRPSASPSPTPWPRPCRARFSTPGPEAARRRRRRALLTLSQDRRRRS